MWNLLLVRNFSFVVRFVFGCKIVLGGLVCVRAVV